MEKALVDEERKVIDIWIKLTLTNKTRVLKGGLRFSSYLRELLKSEELIDNKEYRAVKGLRIAQIREEKRRQVIEGLFARVRNLELSGWRYKPPILTYLTTLGVASFI